MAMVFARKTECPNCNKVFHENEIVYDESIGKDLCPYCGCVMKDDICITENPYENGCCEYCNNNVNGVCCYIGEACDNIARCDDFHDWSVD